MNLYRITYTIEGQSTENFVIAALSEVDAGVRADAFIGDRVEANFWLDLIQPMDGRTIEELDEELHMLTAMGATYHPSDDNMPNPVNYRMRPDERAFWIGMAGVMFAILMFAIFKADISVLP